MGFFRRYKLTDYTADECRDECDRIVHYLSLPIDLPEIVEVEEMMRRWACFRELLARHEKQNQSPLDKNND